MTAEQTIDYEALAQNAMRGVVRSILIEVARTGLPGEHHFFISFDTQAPGVSLSKRLKEKYPEEMTVVLQHRFWDLIVTDERFEVKLTFDGIPERLVVPFQSLRVFFDPSVRYGMQFEDPSLASEAVASPEGEGAARAVVLSSISPDASRSGGRATRTGERKPRAPRKAKNDKTGDTPAATPAPGLQPAPGAAAKPSTQPSGDATSPAKPADAAPPPAGAQVVSLDAFRKK